MGFPNRRVFHRRVYPATTLNAMLRRGPSPLPRSKCRTRGQHVADHDSGGIYRGESGQGEWQSVIDNYPMQYWVGVCVGVWGELGRRHNAHLMSSARGGLCVRECAKYGE